MAKTLRYQVFEWVLFYRMFHYQTDRIAWGVMRTKMTQNQIKQGRKCCSCELWCKEAEKKNWTNHTLTKQKHFIERYITKNVWNYDQKSSGRLNSIAAPNYLHAGISNICSYNVAFFEEYAITQESLWTQDWSSCVAAVKLAWRLLIISNPFCAFFRTFQ